MYNVKKFDITKIYDNPPPPLVLTLKSAHNWIRRKKGSISVMESLAVFVH